MHMEEQSDYMGGSEDELIEQNNLERKRWPVDKKKKNRHCYRGWDQNELGLEQ